MKNTKILAFLALLLAFACTQETFAPVSDDANTPIAFRSGDCDGPSVTPVVYDEGPGGNTTCDQLGLESMVVESCKRDYDGGQFDAGECATWPDGLTVTVTDGKYVSFIYDNPGYCVGAVIVKGGPGSNSYIYPDGVTSDCGLVSPNVPSGPADLSNLTFCIIECDNGEEECWDDETAWAAGSRYVTRGNWATYTPYVAGSTVTLFAGQTLDAGTVSFSDVVNGEVTITINLNTGWRFAIVDENVKIQDYATAPSGNPSPGLFAHKATAAGSPFSITVPANNFYGVHVDVERLVPCEE